ncbi:glycine-rich domain-containing protein [Planomonospora algeriensis]
MSTIQAQLTNPADPADPRTLISDSLLDRLAARVAAEQDVPGPLAERVVEQTLAFLTACALNPDTPLSPSKAVDPGWHIFLEYSQEYADFCERIAGRFLHHVPDDAPGARPVSDPAAAIGATVAAMRAAGLPVDTELWVPAAQCSQCYAGCADDPKES